MNGYHKSRARHVYKVSVQVNSNLDDGVPNMQLGSIWGKLCILEV